MKIALAQFNPTVGDFSGNSAKILELTQIAQQRGADLAVFSELCLCGYLPLDLIERPQFISRNEKELACLAKKLPIPAIVGYAAHANEATGKAEYRDLALDWAGKVEKTQPWHAWAYALEAKLSTGAVTRRRAIGMANYLDPDSDRLRSIPKEELDAAVKEFRNPFLNLASNKEKST